jgi:hypothetical protein
LTGDMGNTFLVLFGPVATVAGPADAVGAAQRFALLVAHA